MGIENEVELSIASSGLNLEEGQKLELNVSPEIQVETTDGSKVLTVGDVKPGEDYKFRLKLFLDISMAETADFEVHVFINSGIDHLNSKGAWALLGSLFFSFWIFLVVSEINFYST